MCVHCSEGISDRYYSALYRKLSDGSVTSSAHLPQLFHLLHKSFRSDPVDSRVGTFLKRLFQLSLDGPANFACAALLLASELLKEKPDLLRLRKIAQVACTISAVREWVFLFYIEN